MDAERAAKKEAALHKIMELLLQRAFDEYRNEKKTDVGTSGPSLPIGNSGDDSMQDINSK